MPFADRRPERPRAARRLARRFPRGVLGRLPGATLAAIAAATLAAAPSARADEIDEIVRHSLYDASLGEGESALAGLLAKRPSGNAGLGLGGIRFLKAVETLEQSLFRHGLVTPPLPTVPLLRLPVPRNADPQPLTYETFREILRRFDHDLGQAQETLDAVAGSETRLTIDLAKVRLDFDGDGKVSDGERLWTVLRGTDPRLARSPLPGSEPAPETFPVTFDAGDVLWLRGYTHLLRGIVAFWLAHDFSAQFEQSYHIFFPRAGLRDGGEPGTRPGPQQPYDAIADLIAFVHLMTCPVVERGLLSESLAHLRAVPELSRQSWAAILSETDDENEWLPNPRQADRFPSLPVSQERIDAWLKVMDLFEDVLHGRRLIPHWRLAKGINLPRAMVEHRVFDPVLWATGIGLAPYLEDGPTVTAAEWHAMTTVFRADLFGYAFRFN